MPSLVDTLMGGVTEGKLNNTVIANDMLAAAKAGAAAYLMASLESATPEIKNLFFTNVSQLAQDHAAMTDLALKKGWYKPYQSPDEQLKETYTYSQTFTHHNA